MVLFNHATREMTAKIVYYGPGLCGKTTNLMVIFDKLDPKQKGKMLSLATKTDRTLFFDLLPVDIGKVGNFNLRMQLYTVPGQVFYNETRKLVLRGADAVVFVADSQPSMVESTRESFTNLMDNLKENNIEPADTPIVIQFNKRDLPGVLPVGKLQEALGVEGYPFTEASAIKGEGVMETFKLVSKITAKHLFNRLKGKGAPIDRKKPEKPAKAAHKPSKTAHGKTKVPEPELEPFPEASTDLNPFADSMPFPESNPLDAGYEKMEEVSLEQLLEGRERPATLSGSIPTPIPIHDVEEVEEMGTHDLLSSQEDSPLAFALDELPPFRPEAPSGNGALEQQVRQLEQQISQLRAEHRASLEEILRTLGELTTRVRSRLSQ
jgi:signal recognition particle receptor subunit beta